MKIIDRILEKLGLEYMDCGTLDTLKPCPRNYPDCHFYDNGFCNPSRKHLLEKFSEIGEKDISIYIAKVK